MPRLEIADDESEATLILAEGERMNATQAVVFLARNHVRFGHQPGALADLASQIGPLQLVVARAETPIAALDAQIEWPAGQATIAYAPVLAQGRQTFPPLEAPRRVSPGDVVAQKRLAIPGRPARGVKGTVLGQVPAPPGDVTLVAGPGVAVSADGIRAVAEAAGNVVLRDGAIGIQPELRIGGALEVHIGDVNFAGNVLIEGDVEVQRQVVATGDITVLGVVEGATLRAGGHIVVSGGVRQGAVLDAAGDVIVLYLDGSEARSLRRVIVREDSTHATIMAGETLLVGGSLVGGQVEVRERADLHGLGGPLQTATRVAVLPPPPPPDPRLPIARERADLAAKADQVRLRMDEAKRVAVRHGDHTPKGFEAGEMLDQLTRLYSSLMHQDQELRARADAVILEIPPPIRRLIIVRGECLPGVTLQVEGATLTTDMTYPPCTFQASDTVMSFVPLDEKGGPP